VKEEDDRVCVKEEDDRVCVKEEDDSLLDDRMWRTIVCQKR
jgi:hypothetical protein